MPTKCLRKRNLRMILFQRHFLLFFFHYLLYYRDKNREYTRKRVEDVYDFIF